MRAVDNCIRPCSRPTSPSSTTVFTPAFLERIRRLQNPPSARQATFSGPWEVESVPSRENGRKFAVCRREEPFSQGGPVFGVFPTRTPALQTAAVLPALGAPMDLQLNTNGQPLGYKLHDGQSFLGHLAVDDERLLPHLHVARCLVANPEALALLMEAAGPETLTILGRALQRRIEKVAG